MVTMVFSFVSSDIAAWIRCSFSGSTLAVASSSIIIGASFRIALAMEMRCFSPPFQTEKEQRDILQKLYKETDIHVDGSMVYFRCVK